jgi:hypothetical protein
VGNIDRIELRTVLASLADRQDQIAAAHGRILVQDNRGNLVARREVLTTTICACLDD